MVALTLNLLATWTYSLHISIRFHRLVSLPNREHRRPLPLKALERSDSDIMITSLVLNKLIRSRTGWTHTDRILKKLAILTMESQAPPTLFCLIAAVHFSVKFT